MTVPSEQSRIQYTTDGTSVSFPVPFRFLNAAHLQVARQHKDESSILELGVDYSVSGVGNQAGGTITTTTTLPAGDTISIERVVPITQETAYQRNDPFPERAHEQALDKLTMICQMLGAILGLTPGSNNRALLLGAGDMDGNGAYRANGNRIRDLGAPQKTTDAARKQDIIEALADLSTDGSGQFVVERLADAVDPENGDAMIGVKQPFSGSISRTQHEKNQDIVSRVEFADDASFNAAKAGRPSIDGAGRFDAPVAGVGQTASITRIAQAALTASDAVSSAPAYLEQHLSGFFGRGMLAAEANNLFTERFVTVSAAAGVDLISCSSPGDFIVGSCITIQHDNGRYGTYFVSQVSGTALSIAPRLRYACTENVSKLERTWFNRAHPGKFYMRELAQRIAHSTESEAAMPNGRRILFTNFASNPNTIEDTFVAVGGTAVSYFPPSNVGESGTSTSPVRFALGRTAYVENLSPGVGAETNFFDTQGVARAVVKFAFLSGALSSAFSVFVYDENSEVIGSYPIDLGSSQGILRIYTFHVEVRDAKKIKVRFSCEAGSGGYFVVDQIDVFEAPVHTRKIVSKLGATIVCLGDSWVAGDMGSTLEREPITQQLALELPDAKIINAGVGGNTIVDMLNRFDTDVEPHRPDYVVINTGTNESYNPLSGTFEPTAIDAFLMYFRLLLARINAIGARPIIIGVPALAQSDPEVPAFPEWTLNDRAKAYARHFFEWQSARPVVMSGSNEHGSWFKEPCGKLVCTHRVEVTTSAAGTLASTPWVFPQPFVTGSTLQVVTSPAHFPSNQLYSSGAQSITHLGCSVMLATSASALTVPLDCVAVGRWRN